MFFTVLFEPHTVFQLCIILNFLACQWDGRPLREPFEPSAKVCLGNDEFHLFMAIDDKKRFLATAPMRWQYGNIDEAAFASVEIHWKYISRYKYVCGFPLRYYNHACFILSSLKSSRE